MNYRNLCPLFTWNWFPRLLMYPKLNLKIVGLSTWLLYLKRNVLDLMYWIGFLCGPVSTSLEGPYFKFVLSIYLQLHACSVTCFILFFCVTAFCVLTCSSDGKSFTFRSNRFVNLLHTVFTYNVNVYGSWLMIKIILCFFSQVYPA